MKDPKTLAYINMYAIFGALENLCELDENARVLLTNKKPISIGFDVSGGPSATLTFKNGRCRLDDGIKKCDILIPFPSCAKFNGMIDGVVTPIPVKGFTHIGFLLKDFTALTDLLTKYLRPEPDDLKDERFFEISTKLTLYVVAVAIAQIGNQDDIGRFSAHYIPDGVVKMGVKGGPYCSIVVENHHLLTLKKEPAKYRAIMEFKDLKLASELFAGNVNAVACIGEGSIVMGGMINMIDNINRILDRVSIYLA